VINKQADHLVKPEAQVLQSRVRSGVGSIDMLLDAAMNQIDTMSDPSANTDLSKHSLKVSAGQNGYQFMDAMDSSQTHINDNLVPSILTQPETEPRTSKRKSAGLANKFKSFYDNIQPVTIASAMDADQDVTSKVMLSFMV
jgi:hypothetical protein